jgi:hypothetical protein
MYSTASFIFDDVGDHVLSKALVPNRERILSNRGLLGSFNDESLTVFLSRPM